MDDTHTGACFCGAVQIEVTGAPEEMGYCHCASCRSYAGGLGERLDFVEGGARQDHEGGRLLGGFNKTGMSDRQFCKQCGGHVMTDHPGLGFTDVYAAVIPGVSFRPIVHLNYAETVLPMKDGLPKLKDFPAEVGGSGEAMPE